MNIIDLYISNMKKEDIIKFSQKKGITLSDSELDFVYKFIKNNYKDVLKNKDSFNLEEYRNYFTKENYIKISNLIKEYINYL